MEIVSFLVFGNTIEHLFSAKKHGMKHLSHLHDDLNHFYCLNAKNPVGSHSFDSNGPKLSSKNQSIVLYK